MPQVLRMPAVAANSDRAVLSAWAVSDHSSFSTGDTLAEVETDKAVVDIAAEIDGVMIMQLVPAGTEVDVGHPIAIVTQGSELSVDVTALLADLGIETEPKNDALSEDPAIHAQATVGETAKAIGNILDPVTHPEGGRSIEPPPTTSRIFASPLARRLAKEARISLAELKGTGPGGRVRRDDVREALAARERHNAVSEFRPDVTKPSTTGRSVAADRPLTAPENLSTLAHNWVDEPQSTSRKVIASRLTESKTTIPHFYLSASARVDRLLALRAELNAGRSTKISVNDLLTAAAARAYTAVPEMNTIWTNASLRRLTTVDISIAVASKRGLVTPTLRQVETLSITAVSASAKELISKADSGGLRKEDLEGGSLTISNLGMFGIEDFTAIIDPSRSAILAVGASHQEAVVTDGHLDVATILRMTLSVDHRALDGVIAARWLTELVSLLEDPLRVLS